MVANLRLILVQCGLCIGLRYFAQVGKPGVFIWQRPTSKHHINVELLDQNFNNDAE